MYNGDGIVKGFELFVVVKTGWVGKHFVKEGDLVKVTSYGKDALGNNQVHMTFPTRSVTTEEHLEQLVTCGVLSPYEYK